MNTGISMKLIIDEVKHSIMSNIKSHFVPDFWIKCMHNGEICIGRTYIQDSASMKIKSLMCVSLVSENGHTKQVPFSEITNVAFLKIFTTLDFETESTIKKTFNGQKTKPFGLVRTLAQQQLKTKMS